MERYWFWAAYKGKFEPFHRAQEIVFAFSHDFDFDYPEKQHWDGKDYGGKGPIRGAVQYLEALARAQGLEEPEVLKIQPLGEISKCGNFISLDGGYVPECWQPAAKD